MHTYSHSGRQVRTLNPTQANRYALIPTQADRYAHLIPHRQTGTHTSFHSGRQVCTLIPTQADRYAHLISLRQTGTHTYSHSGRQVRTLNPTQADRYAHFILNHFLSRNAIWLIILNLP